MNKPAPSEFPIVSVLADRWSPVAFSSEPVEESKLQSLFEAARWAPSCFNEQPWRFLFARRGTEAFDKMAGCLMEANAWATSAPILVLAVARMTFERNGQPNRFGMYDTGQAVAQLLVQAEADGLCAHQMGGYDAGKARTEFGIPEGEEPCAMIAIGYYGDHDSLPEKSRLREEAPRVRKPQSEFCFEGAMPTVPKPE